MEGVNHYAMCTMHLLNAMLRCMMFSGLYIARPDEYREGNILLGNLVVYMLLQKNCTPT